MNTVWTHALLVPVTFAMSWIVVKWWRRRALRQGILDIPNARSSHHVPTPRGGGIGIVMAVTVVIVYEYIMGSLSMELTLACLGGIPVAAVGAMDDKGDIGAGARFLVHVAAAVWAVGWLPGPDVIVLGTTRLTLGGLSPVVTVTGIVWLLNLYNFMDGSDGLAGSQSVFVGLFAAFVLASNGHHGLAWVSVALATASLAFLCWNWPPAKLFLGDVGSGFIGYLIAILALATEKFNPGTALSICFIPLALFVADATLTLSWRIAKGEQWYAAHRSHAYQQLLSLGWTHQRLLTWVLVTDIFLCLPLAVLSTARPAYGTAALAIVYSVLLAMWCFIQRRARNACTPP